MFPLAKLHIFAVITHKKQIFFFWTPVQCLVTAFIAWKSGLMYILLHRKWHFPCWRVPLCMLQSVDFEKQINVIYRANYINLLFNLIWFTLQINIIYFSKSIWFTLQINLIYRANQYDSHFHPALFVREKHRFRQ